MKQWLLKGVGASAVLLAGMALLVWVLWIPTAQEPPYRYIRTGWDVHPQYWR